MGGIILGMPGPWADNFLEQSDHYTSKIGGLPDWPIPDIFIEPDLLNCGACGERLCLVAQIYAPVSTSKLNIDERVVYVFGCSIPKCGSSPKWSGSKEALLYIVLFGDIVFITWFSSIKVCSWRVLRIQKCNGEKHTCQCSKPLEEVSALISSNGNGVKIMLANDNGESVEEACDDLDFDALARELSEASSQASQSKKQNGSLMSEGHKKTIQTRPTVKDVSTNIPVVPCFYVYPQEERSFGDVATVCANYAALSVKGEDDSSDDHKEEEVWEGEGYEYDNALGADRTFLKFKKWMDTYPEQCFRYSFGGKPLLVKSNLVEPNPCRLCGSARQYEMQLMPPLLYFLQEAADGSSASLPEEWNWMTLLVYTCSSSCCPCLCEDQLGRCCWAAVEEEIVIQD